MSEVSFGEWLKRRRNAVGLTQAQLALQLHCSTSALRKFESELRHPSAEIVDQLAEIFDIPQEERKAFLRYARGDWQAISSGGQEEAPWKVSPVSPAKQIKTAAPRNNLPLQLTSFIGREEEQEEVTGLLTQRRLVTLVGAGGIGKTRLSLKVARRALNTFTDGLWFIELAPLSDPALVPQAIVSALGLIEQANRSPQVILADFLKAKRALLIFDNCEHLVQAAAQLIETLLQTCSDLHILATSREALGISGEWIHNVATLSIPDLQQSLTTASLTECEAVRLFLDRAQTVVHDFELTPENALAIAQICHHLDGIPLALELAAARLRGLSVEQIAARLDDRFHLLTSGARTVLPRHQTLQALIDWSHDLLTEPERILLRRLSIFAGGWTLEAAEAVCAGDGIASNQILDSLLHLVDKSLVSAETQDTETRYHMLETIRQYAREKQWKAGEGELIRQRHLAYFVDLAERAEPNLRAFGMIEWLDRLQADFSNIRTALAYSLESDIEGELQLASALLWFWHIRGYKNEGIDWLERGLSIEATERGDQPLKLNRTKIRAKALNVSGCMLCMWKDLRKAATRLEDSLTLFQQLGTEGKQGMAFALMRLGGLPSAGNQARSMLEQSLALFHEIDDKFGVAECLMLLAGSAQADDDYKRAINSGEKQLALRRETGDSDGIASALADLGDLAFWQDDYQKAITLYEESLAMYRIVGNKWAMGLALSVYGSVFLWQGNYERAVQIYEEALTFAQDINDRFLIAYNSYGLGTIIWFRGDYAHAAQMITDSVAVFRDVGHHWLTASSLHALGDIALSQGDEERAVQCYEAELVVGQEEQLNMSTIFAIGGLGKVAWVKGDYSQAVKRFDEELMMSNAVNLKLTAFHARYGLGRVAQSQGDYVTAHTHYEKALEIQKKRINHPFKWLWLKAYGAAVGYPIEALAILDVVQNQMQRATHLFSAAEELYPPLRYEMSARERLEHDQAIAAARLALGEEAFNQAWEEGKAMKREQAVAYALEGEED